MTRQQLIQNIKNKKSFLCVGLDSDMSKLPQCVLKYDEPIWEFNKRIIDSTYKYAIAYKPNVAFYESLGSKGWQALEKTVNYIRQVDPSIFKRNIHRTQDVEMRVKLLERVVIVIVAHTAHAINLGACGK